MKFSFHNLFFLAIILQLPTQFNSSASKLISRQAGVSKLDLLYLSLSLVTTDCQSASLSWKKAPIWGLRPNSYYCQTVAGFLIWGALSDERTSLSFKLLLVLASAVIFGSQSLFLGILVYSAVA
jgi:hypothetical protein